MSDCGHYCSVDDDGYYSDRAGFSATFVSQGKAKILQDPFALDSVVNEECGIDGISSVLMGDVKVLVSAAGLFLTKNAVFPLSF